MSIIRKRELRDVELCGPCWDKVIELVLDGPGYKLLVLRALRKAKKVRPVPRLDGVKFDENRPVVRLDLDSFKGLTVGDLCRIKPELEQAYLFFIEDFGPRDLIEQEFRVMAFVELEGHLKEGKGAKVRDILAVVGRVEEHYDSNENVPGRPFVPRLQRTVIAGSDNGALPLFWPDFLARGLKKSGREILRREGLILLGQVSTPPAFFFFSLLPCHARSHAGVFLFLKKVVI